MFGFTEPSIWDYTEIEAMLDAREAIRERFNLDGLPDELDWQEKKLLKTELKMLTHDKFRHSTTYLKTVRQKHITASGNVIDIYYTETAQNEDAKLELMEKEVRSWSNKLDAYSILVLLNYISRVFVSQEMRKD